MDRSTTNDETSPADPTDGHGWACLGCSHHWEATGRASSCPECGRGDLLAPAHQYHAPVTDLALAERDTAPDPDAGAGLAADVRALKRAVAHLWRVLTDEAYARGHIDRLTFAREAAAGIADIEDHLRAHADDDPDPEATL